MAVNHFYFNSRDELLRVDVGRIVYFEGAGNYTDIVMANGQKGTVGMNLIQTEHLLAQGLGERARHFARIGKRYIVNLDYVFQISVLRQRLVLSDFSRFAYTLEISREALRKLKDLYVANNLKSQTLPSEPH